jgi:hypothetical protein
MRQSPPRGSSVVVVIEDAVWVLAVELGEADVVGLVCDDKVEPGPYQSEAAVLGREPADDFGAAIHLAGGRSNKLVIVVGVGYRRCTTSASRSSVRHLALRCTGLVNLIY